MPTDLGLDWLASADVFGLVVCLGLFLLGVKMKSFPFVGVSAIGTIAIGLRIFLASEDPLVFMIMFALSGAMVLHGAKFEGW